METSDARPSATVLAVYGTRPEAIKMAPVVSALSRADNLALRIVVTGQHRKMLDQVNALFEIRPSHDLAVLEPRQTLEQVTSAVLRRLDPILAAEQPHCVLVQGDTTSSFAAALTAFYHRIPVVHMEAGLRTNNRYDPFPEEINRRLTTQLTSLHLAPTPTSRANLEREGVDPDQIVVTGNTVIDALLDVVSRTDWNDERDHFLRALELQGRRFVLVTMHRRESWGPPMARSSRAIRTLAQRFPEVVFVLPLHLNPAVREVVVPVLRDCRNIRLIEPAPYREFANLMAASTLVLTDSGGVQEEAPSLGKPVLVMRETTERPEAVFAGTVRLVGTVEERIVDEVSRLLTSTVAYNSMAHAVNPYGDGQAARRSVQAIRCLLGLGPRPDEFTPPPFLTSNSATTNSPPPNSLDQLS